MKRIFLLFAAVFASVGLVSAATISADEAMAAADIWAAENAAFGAGVRAVSVLTVCDTNQAKTVLWHQVSMTGGGCLMMAPVTEIEPVVAALQTDPGEMPANHPLRGILAFDMRNRLRFLGLYAEDRRAVSNRLGMAAGGGVVRSDDELAVAKEWGTRQSAKWTRLLGRSAGLPKTLKADAKKGVVDPIPIEIGIVDGFEKGGRYTHWNQGTAAVGGHCYDYYTTNHAVCGCVATAMSAVMQYYACQGVCKVGESGPEVITDAADAPTSSGCTYNDVALGKIACIPGPAEEGEEPLFSYDWSIFDEFATLDDYKDSSKMDDQHRELLGRVAYNAGVMVNMMWTDAMSSAYPIYIADALRDAFGFTDARYVSGITQDQYAKLIYQQCWTGQPVIMSIDGHEVVAVGFGKDGDGVDRVRVFLGWGGSADAWYALPYIETASVLGGSTYLSEMVSGVITMMAVDGSGTYPVCGRVMPSIATEIECGGTTLHSNGNGYFGLRVVAGTKLDVACQGCSTPVEVGEEVKAKKSMQSKYMYDGAELCAAIPGTFMLPLVTFETAITTPMAQKMALASGKLIFAYNDPDSPSGIAVFNVIKKLSEENYCDCTNRYVFIALSYGNYSVYEFNPDTPATQADYNGTSYGVFDPEVFVPANRWAFTNGRLEYSRVSDYELDDEDKPVATAETEEAVRSMLSKGWEQHLRRNSKIKLEVVGDPGEAGEVSPAWGLHAPTCVDGVYVGYTNGEEVVFSAPMYVTNEAAGVIWKCDGWELTNDTVFAESGLGNEGSFSAIADTSHVLVWKWKTVGLRVSATSAASNDGNRKATITKVVRGDETKTGEGADFIWCTSGDEVTFTVETRIDTIKYVLDKTVWSVAPTSTVFKAAVYEGNTNGTITVTVADQPICVVIAPHGSRKMQLTVRSVPSICTLGDPDPAYGSAYHYDDMGSASLKSDTAVSNGVSWKCMGWELSASKSGSVYASGSGAVANFALSGASTLTWKWGIDLAAMVPGDWADDPSTDSVMVLEKLPAGVSLENIQFANVPVGWEATPVVDDSGRLEAALQIKAEEWALAKTGVDLTIKNVAEEGELAVECGIASGAGVLTITAPASFIDEDAGIFYEPESWIAKDGSGVEIDSGVGATAVLPTVSEGDTVMLTWTWKAVGVRIHASIDGFVNGKDYFKRFSLDQDEVWCRFNEVAEFTVAIDNSPSSYKLALKDWDVGNSTVYEKDYLKIRVTAQEADGPVDVKAFFDYGRAYTNLIYAACTNGVQVESAFGLPTPAYGTYYTDAKFWNNQMLAKMDVSFYTNIVVIDDAEVTNIWELSGWELRNGGGGVCLSGTGDSANFRVTDNNSVFVWKWQIWTKPERGEPVPPLGPGDTSPMTFVDDVLNINIANTVNGWWYGVYTKTNLSDTSAPWMYLKGFDPGNPATNLLFSIDFDPLEKQRFFKIILTEDEPEAK